MSDNVSNTILDLENRKRSLLAEITSIDTLINGLKSYYSGSGSYSAKTTISATPAPFYLFTDKEIAENREFKEKYSDVLNTITNRQLCVYVIKKEGRFLHLRQIADIAQKIKPHAEGVSYYRKALSPALTKLKSLEKIVSHRVGTNNFNTFWGKFEWLDDLEYEGIKPAHFYDKEYLLENQKETYE